MVVLNPNNWHWVDKNTLPWTKEYFSTSLADLQVVSGDGKHKIVLSEVTNVSGDSNVSQRKGKPICYFDLQLALAVKVLELETAEELVTGSLNVQDFMHDESDFEFQYQNLDAFENLIRNEFVPKLKVILLEYQPTLIKEQSKDLENH